VTATPLGVINQTGEYWYFLRRESSEVAVYKRIISRPRLIRFSSMYLYVSTRRRRAPAVLYAQSVVGLRNCCNHGSDLIYSTKNGVEPDWLLPRRPLYMSHDMLGNVTRPMGGPPRVVVAPSIWNLDASNISWIFDQTKRHSSTSVFWCSKFYFF